MRQPSPPQKSRARCRRAADVRGVGVSTQTRSCKSPARAWAAPARSEPAIGCAPTKTSDAASCDSIASTICRLVLPASVTRAPAGTAWAARRTSCGIRLTGVQTTTTSASATPASRSVVAWSIIPRSCASWSVFRSRPTPTTRAARPRERSASPMEPPISPTPTIATVSRRCKTAPSRRSPAFPSRPELSWNLYLTSPPSPKRDRTSDSGSHPVGTRGSGLAWHQERAEGLPHGLGRLPAGVRLLPESFEQDLLQSFRCIGPVGPQRDRRMIEDHLVRVRPPGIKAKIGVFLGKQVEQRGSCAVNVGRFPDLAELADMLGGEEADRAADVALTGQVREDAAIHHALGQAEIRKLDTRTVDRAHHQQIRRLDVAMDVTLGMREVQGREQVLSDQRGGSNRHGLLERSDPIERVLAVHVLHHKLEVALDLEQLVELDDARVALAAGHEHVAQGADLTVEVVQGFLAGRAVGDHHLDRDPPVAGDLPCPVDGSHAPLADHFLDEVVGTGLGELLPPGLALGAEQGGDQRPQSRQHRCHFRRLCRGEGHTLLELDPTAGAAVPQAGVVPAAGVVDGKRAVAGGDQVTLAEQDPFDPQAVDFGAIGASKVDQVAQGWKVFELEVLAGQSKIPGHRERRSRRSPHDETAASIDLVCLALVRT